MNLCKYIISSNTALSELTNPYLWNLVDKSLKVPTYHTFRHSTLPKILQTLHDALNEKLRKSESICLIVDLWTNRMQLDFLALGASLIDDDLHQELLILGMERMQGPHNAENIKQIIEKIVNSYSFNKTKINCNLFV